MNLNLAKEKTSKRLDEERILNYIEKRLKRNFPWVELSDGKLFCKVRNIRIASIQENVSIFWDLNRIKQ